MKKSNCRTGKHESATVKVRFIYMSFEFSIFWAGVSVHAALINQRFYFYFLLLIITICFPPYRFDFVFSFTIFSFSLVIILPSSLSYTPLRPVFFVSRFSVTVTKAWALQEQDVCVQNLC